MVPNNQLNDKILPIKPLEVEVKEKQVKMLHKMEVSKMQNQENQEKEERSAMKPTYRLLRLWTP